MLLSTYQYWSATHGAEVVRVSLADAQGQEFYAFLPAVEGRTGRQLRAKASEALTQAMDLGLAPGEIRWK